MENLPPADDAKALQGLVRQLREDRSERTYQRLRRECRHRVISVLGEGHPDLRPVVNQVVHDLVAATLAGGLPVDVVCGEDWPRSFNRWTSEQSWDAARKRTQGDPEEMTFAAELEINLQRRIGVVSRLGKQLRF